MCHDPATQNPTPH